MSALKPDSTEEFELEIKVFDAYNNSEDIKEVKAVLALLWFEFCKRGEEM